MHGLMPIATTVAGAILWSACACGLREPSAGDAGGQESDGAVPADAAAVRRRRFWLKLLGYTALAIVLLIVAVRMMESRMVFRPSSEPFLGTWESAPAGAEYVRFKNEEGLTLTGWYYPGPGGGLAAAVPFVISCHGNAGNMSHSGEYLSQLGARGYGFLAFNYRGYGESEGTPSEEGIYRDVEAAYDYAVEQRGVRPCRVVAQGFSLGAAVALHLALNRDVQCLVMDSAFTNLADMVKKYPAVRPLVWLMQNKFDNLSAVRELDVPLMMVHGKADAIVPIELGRQVFAAAPNPKQFWPFVSGEHMDAFMVNPDTYWDKFGSFCRRYANCL